MNSPTLEGPVITWQSPVCSCYAELQCGINQQPSLRSCDNEHRPWLEAVGAEQLQKRLDEVVRAYHRGVPASFHRIFDRYYRPNETFHRPQPVTLNPNAVDALFGLFIKESLGVDLASCSEPDVYAACLCGKAIRGLTEKMWLEDYFNPIPDCGRLFLPEELVADGDITVEEAALLFKRKMDASLINELKVTA